MIATGWSLSSKLSGEVDRKTDDGSGWAGRTRLSTWRTRDGSFCVSTTTGVWIEGNPRLVKRSVDDAWEEKIAAMHPDFDRAYGRCA